jgi:predicted transcriptional regulator
MKSFIRTQVTLDDDTLHALQRLGRTTRRPFHRFIADVLRDFVDDARATRCQRTRQRRSGRAA